MSEQLKKGRSAVVWDVPTRLFHWLLVAAFVTAWVSNEESRHLDVHVFAGYLFAGLLLFRLLWGVAGTHYARFREFSYGPAEVVGYLKGLLTRELRRYIGHNPAGAWAIFILIGLGVLLSVSGLLLLGGQEHQGPLAGVITLHQSALFHEVHEFAANAMLAMVFIHIGGVVVESILHRENLVRAMVHGKKQVGEKAPVVAQYTLLGVAMLAIVAGFGVTSFSGYVTETKDKPYLPFKGQPLAMNDLWNESCGECHLAFHPSLLPIRSWEKMLAEQDHHFGDDLALDQDTVDELLKYAKANSADLEQTKPAWRINSSIPAKAAPLRISEVKYWKRKHEEIGDEIWKRKEIKSKANCGACHLDAKQGSFAPSAMRVPGEFRVTEWLKSALGGNKQ